jgi:RNA-binding protein YlmH
MIKDKLGDYKKIASLGDIVLTDFLDFEEQNEIYALEKSHIEIELFGGFDDAERKRALIGSSNNNQNDFDIVIIQSSFDSKYGAIGHRNVLGTIMSLGIERNTFGDIVVEDNLITIFVSKEISEYLIKNLSMISHQRMNWEIISSFKQSNIKEEVKTINVASMRLDAVVAKSINVGRSEAVEIINSGNVLINHKQCLNITHNVKEQDILSIRKFGRIEILEIVGLSKKNRTIVEIRVKH